MTDKSANSIQTPVAYKQALYSYWNEDFKASIEQIGTGLETSDQNESHLFYRLWIEILADDSDNASLNELVTHLEQIADENSYTIYALVGLALLEMDRIEASSLYAESLVDSDDIYAKELIHRLKLEKAVL